MGASKISRFIEKLYDEYYKSLWGYAYYLSKDKNIADDIVQTVFMNIIKNKERLRRIFSGDIPMLSGTHSLIRGYQYRVVTVGVVYDSVGRYVETVTEPTTSYLCY